MLLTRSQKEADMARLFDRMQAIEGERELGWLRT